MNKHEGCNVFGIPTWLRNTLIYLMVHQLLWYDRIEVSKSALFNDTHKQNCALLNSVHRFIEIEAWLLLTFFWCLPYQLNSIHTIVTYWRVHMFEKCDSSNKQKWIAPSFSISVRFYGKIRVGFCLKTGKCFFLEVSF